MSTIPLKLDDVLSHLKKEHKVELQEEHKQISFTLTIKEKEVPVFVGILHESLLQIIAYLPYELQEKAFGEVARFLHIINKELDMPGFGMDENGKLVFYRLVIPCLEPEINPEMIDAHLRTVNVACQTILEGIDAASDQKSPLAKAARVQHAAQNLTNFRV
jgi:hypothetical protein